MQRVRIYLPTHPQEPVARATTVHKVAFYRRHREVISVLWDSLAHWLRHGDAVLDRKRANKAPSKDTTGHEAPRGVQTGKHTRAEESRGELNDPAPRFTGNGTLPAPGIEPPEDVPVSQQAWCIITERFVDECTSKGASENEHFLPGGKTGGSRSGQVKRTNCERCRRGTGEYKLLLDYRDVLGQALSDLFKERKHSRI
jgi:hypothetical protein